MNKEEVSTTISGWWKQLRLAGLILGLILGGLLWLGVALLMIGMSGMPTDPIGLSLEEWIGIIVPGVIIIGSVAIAWKWELIGAIILITEGAFWLILKLTPIAYDLSYLPPWIAVLFVIISTSFSSILLVPGILFLVSWLVERSQLKAIGKVENMIAGEMWIGLGIGMVFLVGSLITVQLGAARPPTVVVHYDGSGWSKMDSGTTNYLIAVWGNSPSDVFAGGLRGTICHYDGSDWSKMSSKTNSWFRGVWGSSRTDIFAVGGREPSR